MIVKRELTAVVADWADPSLCGEIDTCEGVESGGAIDAEERSVRQGDDVAVVTDRRDGSSERDHAFAGFDFGSWPDVPSHTNSIDSFWIH